MNSYNKIVVSHSYESLHYSIILGITLINIIRDIKKQFQERKIFIVTDANVAKYYGHQFYNLNWPLIIIPAGERSKTQKYKEIIENKLIKWNADRDSIIIALGGGMVGDLAGFTAATFMRGIDYIQIPTSLLAQVDSSIGGKTGINHPNGKNLIGAFHHPVKVYIDIETLQTLPVNHFYSGMAEVIKYAVSMDKDLFDYLEKHHKKIIELDKSKLLYIIKRCIILKKEIVQKDEREKNYRRILNFGHTIGHALELYSGFKILHGQAVAIGMMMEAKISKTIGILNEVDYKKLKYLLLLYKLPTEIPEKFDIGKLCNLTIYDKKNIDNNVNYTLIEAIGKGIINVPLKIKKVQEILLT